MKSPLLRVFFGSFFQNWLGFVLGPLCFTLSLLISPGNIGLSKEAFAVIGMIVWMAVWWITEAVPIPVTALLPIILIPLLGIDTITATTSAYSNPLIYLFLGGFFLSIAMEKWNLHKRIALSCMKIVGTKPGNQLAGIMGVTAFLSMWMSNTATAVMMLPIAQCIIELKKQHSGSESDGFAKALLLGIAYAASIGGIATLIGSPPNALLAGYLQKNYNINLGFSEWMLMGLPLSLVMLVVTWILLGKVLYRLDDASCENKTMSEACAKMLKDCGPMSKQEKLVLLIFVSVALSWIFRPLITQLTGLALDDTIIAILGVLALFMVPTDLKGGRGVLAWEDAKKIPWGILLLFGGGLSLADQIQNTGLAEFIASAVAGVSASAQPLVVLIMIVTVIVFLTEVTSNTATAAGFIPLLGPIALALGGSLAPLLIGTTLGVSFAFMMPVATPPNSIVFSSGDLKIKDMMRAGFILNILSIAAIVLTASTLVPLIFQF